MESAHMDTSNRPYKYFFPQSRAREPPNRPAEKICTASCCGAGFFTHYRGGKTHPRTGPFQSFFLKRVAQRRL